MVSTRAVTDRRSLRFDAIDGILADVEALNGTRLRTTGNWTAGQIVLHVSLLIGASLDGFGYRLPLPIRVLARLGKERTLRGGMKPGFPVPKKLSHLRPGPEVTWDDALADLRGNTRRIGAGEQMTAESPLFGRMTHREWVRLHCRHAELHLSFVHGD